MHQGQRNGGRGGERGSGRDGSRGSRGGGGGGRGGPSRGRGGRGGPKRTEAEPPPLTKKEIERQQALLKLEQAKALEQKVKENERAKEQQSDGHVAVDLSTSLVHRKATNELERVPDLSPHWLDPTLSFVSFLPQDNLSSSAASSSLLHLRSAAITTGGGETPSSSASLLDQNVVPLLELLNDSLTRLLKKKYNRFWSQVLYDSNLQHFLDTYLRFCRRSFDETLFGAAASASASPSAAFLRLSSSSDGRSQLRGSSGSSTTYKQQLYWKLSQLVFRVLLRMSTYKEDSRHFMSEAFFRKQVLGEGGEKERRTSSSLWDVPKLLDVSVLWGGVNGGEAARRIVANIFAARPQMVTEDLGKAVPAMLRVLQGIEKRLSLMSNKGSSSGKGQDDSNKIKQQALDVALYLQDIVATLKAFLVDVYPEACTLFAAPQHSFLCMLAKVYDQFVPVLQTVLSPPSSYANGKNGNVKDDDDDDASREDDTNERTLLRIRSFCVFIADALLRRCYFDVLTDGKSIGKQQRRNKGKEKAGAASSSNQKDGERKDKEKLAEELLSEMQKITSLPEPGGGFLRHLTFNFSLRSNLLLSKSYFDSTRLDYLFMILENLCGPVSEEEQELGEEPTAVAPSSSLPSAGLQVDVVRASLISQVRDLFPDLGEGFVATCLHHYEDNAEALINQLLENKLPPELASLDRSMKIPSASTTSSQRGDKVAPSREPHHEKEKVDGAALLARRSNVYAGDEFDVFSGKAPARKDMVYIGKRPNRDNDLRTADQAELRLLKSRMEQYEYEDEYDDSYDDVVRLGDADGESLQEQDPIPRNPNRPVTWLPEQGDVGEEELGDDEEVEGDEGEKEGEEEKRTEEDGKQTTASGAKTRGGGGRGRGGASTRGRGGRGRGGRGRGGGGEGGEVPSLKTRKAKEKNKAKVANHNRRQRAAAKRGRGMLGV